MGRLTSTLRIVVAAVVFSFGSGVAFAQLPPTVIQVFMPGGGSPPGVVRLNLVSDEGFMDTVFTDTRGRFEMPTPTSGAAHFTISIETDKRSYDTTTARMSVQRLQPGYISIFLRPLPPEKVTVEVLDVANFEKSVPQKAQAAYKKAMEAAGAKKYEDAIGDLQQAITIYPEYVRAHSDLGVLFMKLDRLDEAVVSFRKATEINQRFFYPRMNLGLVLNRQGKFKEAIEVLTPLYNENPSMLEVRLAYANALTGAGDVVAAEKIYLPILQLKDLPPGTQAIVHYKLGFGLVRQRKFTEAVTALDKAIALQPNSANAHMHLGGALMQLQQNERAERELLRAYELGGASVAGSQLLLGHLYYSLKKFPEAQKAFEQYLKDLPAAPNAAQVSKMIEELKAAKN